MVEAFVKCWPCIERMHPVAQDYASLVSLARHNCGLIGFRAQDTVDYWIKHRQDAFLSEQTEKEHDEDFTRTSERTQGDGE